MKRSPIELTSIAAWTLKYRTSIKEELLNWSRGGGYEFPLINFGCCLLGTVPAAWQTVMLLLFYNSNLHRMTPQQSSGIKLVMPRESTNTMFSRNIKSKAPHSVETKYWTSFSKFFFRKFWGFIYIYLDSCCLLANWVSFKEEQDVYFLQFWHAAHCGSREIRHLAYFAFAKCKR